MNKASQSGCPDPAALSAVLGTDGKKEAIFSLNSVSWKRQQGIQSSASTLVWNVQTSVSGYVMNAENFPQGEAEHADSTAGQQGAPAQSPEGQGSSGLWGRRCCHDTLDRKRKWLSLRVTEEQKMLLITAELTRFPAERSKVKRAKENQMVIKARRSHLTEPLWISLFSQSQRRPEPRHHPCRRHRGQEGCTCTQEVRGDGRRPPEVRRIKDRL